MSSEAASRAAWRIRPRETIGPGKMRIVDGKFLASDEGSRTRMTAFFRVSLEEPADDRRLDYSSAMRTALQQQRIRGLFEGLRRAAVPFYYSVLASPAADSGGGPLLEFDLVVGTWADAKGGDEEGLAGVAEQRASVLSATLGVALPNAAVTRLARGELRGYLESLLLPSGKPLAQAASPGMVGAVCEFAKMSPVAASVAPVPQFYVPNSAESGRDGITLGAVVSGGQEFQDFRLQLEDLRHHVTVLGMTGSGKSTTSGSIVRQAAEQGLPVAVLDWHNEYAQVVTAAGGKVVAPGADGFSLNPLDGGEGADPVEHIAMVSDIFSDIYHFTHPQAYMFRNALQKMMSEASREENPSVSSLVRTIEAYPLRSAYDNETKVALLRRLVPLTQGQSGKALGGGLPGIGMEEFLGTTVCVELGHMRDTQSRAVFSDVLLKMIYETKVKRKSSLDHLTVVEEARNIAPARRQEDPPSVGERMISELRKFGEAMMFVAQFPTHLAPEVVKNSGSKIVHRLGWPDDVSIVGDSLGLDESQREYVTRLRVGEAVVGVPRTPKAILVKVRQDPSAAQRNRALSLAAES